MKALILIPLIFLWGEAVGTSPCFDKTLICEFDHETHPAKECFAKLSPKIQESIKADCMSYLGKEEFNTFRRNIEVICDAKGTPVRTVEICNFEYTTTPVEVKLCQFEHPNHPIHDCYNLMGEQIQKSLKADCHNYEETEAINDFVSNIDKLCEIKTSQIRPNELTPATPPVMPVNPCDLDNEAHVAHDCYSLMGPQIQKSIKADCIAAGPTKARDELAMNIEAVCKAKGSSIRDMKIAQTTPPVMLQKCSLNDDSHPMHDCFSQMGSEIQKSVIDDCLKYQNTPEMDDFMKNIELICDNKRSLFNP